MKEKLLILLKIIVHPHMVAILVKCNKEKKIQLVKIFGRIF